MMYTESMTNRQYIFEATQIIEDNLTSELTVRRLSERIGYSLFHFIRLFHGVVGCTPGEYISARRLNRAAEELLSGERKVVDISLDYQFATPEAFSRAFKKHTGMSPSVFRKKGEIRKDLSRLPWLVPFYMDKTTAGEKEANREPEEVSLGEMFLAGRMVEVGKDWSPIGKLWNSFIRMKPPSGASDPLEYAQYSFWDSDGTEESPLFVLAAMMVDRIEEGNTLLYKKVAPARYLRFPHYGPEHRISETYYWLFSSWIPDREFKLSLPYNMELYPPADSPAREKGITAWILLPLEKL